MARPLRIQAPGLTYHITTRGNGRADIFLDDGDRYRFVARLAHVLEALDADCHAYCLMSNHYHLVLTTHSANLSRLMQRLNGPYGQWWNRRHDRVGHLFQGRFHAQIIQSERYLLAACVYDVLNPVRAGMVESPDRWPWSSYRATAGLEPLPTFLRPSPLWQHLGGGDLGATLRRYREFAAHMISSSQPIPTDPVLGDPEFVDRFSEWRKCASREVPSRERLRRPSLETLFAAAQTRAARVRQVRTAHQLGYTQADIARFLELNPSTITKLMKLGSDPEERNESRSDPVESEGGYCGR
jgi:putative transposase